VDERRGLQCLVWLPLAGQPRSRQLPKFVIDFRNEGAGASRAVGIARTSGHKSSHYDTRTHRQITQQLQ